MPGLLDVLLFPAITVLPTWLALSLRGGPLPDWMITFGVIGGTLVLQVWLERIHAYRISWQRRSSLAADAPWLGLATFTALVLEVTAVAGLYAVGAWLAELLREHWGHTLWPSSWPFVAQVVLAVLIADAGHYVAHRSLHEVPWLWRFHRLHHEPDHLHSLNFFRMHPVEISLKTLSNLTPIVLLGANAEVVMCWSVISGVAVGSVNHANIRMRTGWFDEVFSTPTLHRFHHSNRMAEANNNYGNVTILYDRLFGTYLNPQHRGVDVVGLDPQA